MSSPAAKTSHDAREEAYALPLDKIDMSQGHLFQNDIHWPYFERLQRFHTVEVMGEPTRVFSSFVRGYSHLPVRLHRA